MASPPAVACLLSQKGPLQIYDTSAFLSVLQKLPDLTIGGCNVADGAALPAEVDGYSPMAWCQYAKTKAKIASRICRENGALKARISVLEDDLARLRNHEADPLCGADPWVGKSIGSMAVRSSTKCRLDADAWSQWSGSAAAARRASCLLNEEPKNDEQACDDEGARDGPRIQFSVIESAADLGGSGGVGGGIAERVAVDVGGHAQKPTDAPLCKHDHGHVNSTANEPECGRVLPDLLEREVVCEHGLVTGQPGDDQPDAVANGFEKDGQRGEVERAQDSVPGAEYLYGMLGQLGISFGKPDIAKGMDVATKFACGLHVEKDSLGGFKCVRDMAEDYAAEFLSSPSFVIQAPTVASKEAIRDHFKVLREVCQQVLSRIADIFPDEGQRASDIRKCQRALTDKANQAEADALSALEPLQSQDWRRKPQGKFKAVSQRH